MKCFYHPDNDGKAAAFCVHAWAGISEPTDYPIQFLPIDYGQSFPLAEIRPNEQVWIVDYSIQPEEMYKLFALTERVIWIDHHKTAIQKYADFDRPIKGIRRDGDAGCSLTWKYLHWWTQRGSGSENFDLETAPDGLELPLAIELIADRDVWKWMRGNMTAEFHAGIALYDLSPDSEVWWKLLECELNPILYPSGNEDSRKQGEAFFRQVLAEGRTILQYKQQSQARLREAIAWETEFCGHRCLAMNAGRVGSEAFGSDRGKMPDSHDIFITYSHDGRQFTVSMYSERVDVSEIAKQLGGGGHRGAAGFQCAVLPFVRTEKLGAANA